MSVSILAVIGVLGPAAVRKVTYQECPYEESTVRVTFKSPIGRYVRNAASSRVAVESLANKEVVNGP